MSVIAVDGPAASGKGSLARRLAAHYGYHHLDTGLLYRAVGRQVTGRTEDRDAAVAAARGFSTDWLDDPALRTEAAAAEASKVSAIPEVRQALLEFQHAFAARPPGAVLDGRDIGTVICPKAPAKLFVTASVEVRAQRRLKELLGCGTTTIYSAVLQDLIDRDARDRQRTTAPLRPADDALILDTSGLDLDQVFAAALAFVDPRIA